MPSLISMSSLTLKEYVILLTTSIGLYKEFQTEFELNKYYYEKGFISNEIYKKTKIELLKFYNLTTQ
jgi:hypothetical protein